MKFRDVFKLDLKNKGQIKLFKNTINKYGIPTKEIKEIKENIKTDLIINPNKNLDNYIFRYRINNGDWIEVPLKEYVNDYGDINISINGFPTDIDNQILEFSIFNNNNNIINLNVLYLKLDDDHHIKMSGIKYSATSLTLKGELYSDEGTCGTLFHILECERNGDTYTINGLLKIRILLVA